MGKQIVYFLQGLIDLIILLVSESKCAKQESTGQQYKKSCMSSSLPRETFRQQMTLHEKAKSMLAKYSV